MLESLSYLGVIIAAAGPCLWLQQKHWEKTEQERDRDLLKPGKGATPPYPEGIEDAIVPPPGAGLLFLGRTVAYTNKFPFPVISQGNEPYIVLDEFDGALLLSASFFDANGKAICKVENNRITKGAATGFHIEHNSETPHKLAVLNDRFQKIVDVEFINQRTFRIVGDFHMPSGGRLVINDEHLLFETPRHITGLVKPIGFEGDSNRTTIGFELTDPKKIVPGISINHGRGGREGMLLVQDKYVAPTNILNSPRYIPRIPGDPEEGEVMAPGTDPMPVRHHPKTGQPILDNTPNGTVRLYLGDLLTWTGSFPFTVIAQGKDDLMVINRDEYFDVWLNAKFFDATGNIMCEVVNNRIHRNPSNTWALRTTPTRITVLDDRTRPVVDIEYINPIAIRITGDFYLQNGFRVVLNTEADGQQFGKTTLAGMLFPMGGVRPIAIAIDPPKDIGRAIFMAIRTEPLKDEPKPVTPAAD